MVVVENSIFNDRGNVYINGFDIITALFFMQLCRKSWCTTLNCPLGISMGVIWWNSRT
jgi:hypothetical protein